MSEPLPGYLTSEQVANLTGIPYRSLMRYVEAGLLQPFTAGQRKHAARLWTARHVGEARLVRLLESTRASQALTFQALAAVRGWVGDPFGDNLQLVCPWDGADVVMQRGREPVAFCGASAALVIDLGALTLPAPGAPETRK